MFSGCLCFLDRPGRLWEHTPKWRQIQILRTNTQRPLENFGGKKRVWIWSLTGLTQIHVVKRNYDAKGIWCKNNESAKNFCRTDSSKQSGPLWEERLESVEESWSPTRLSERTDLLLVVLRTGRHPHGCLCSLARPPFVLSRRLSQWNLGLEDSENVLSWLWMVSSCKHRSLTWA